MLSTSISIMSSPLTNLRVAVVGASLGGLSIANVAHRLGATVSVWEAFPSGFHLRGGALGSVDTELLQSLRGDSDETFRNSIPNVRGHGHFYGDMWRYLYEGLPEGTVRFGTGVEAMTAHDTDKPALIFSSPAADGDGESAIPPEPVTFDLVIGADGGRSVIREYVTPQEPTYSGYTLWRGLCPTKDVAGPPRGSATRNGFSYQTLGFPVMSPNGPLWNCGVYMAMPESEVAKPTKNRQVTTAMKSVPEWFVPFVRKIFGEGNAKFWQGCSQKGKVAPHPVWEFAADRVVNGRVVLLGDAAHMASPRTGAGAYTAMMDAHVFEQAMSGHNSLQEGLELYNDNTVKRGKQLYRSSRNAASYFAPEHLVPIHPKMMCKA